MLDPKLLRTDIQRVASLLAKRGFVLDIAEFTALDIQRKTLQVSMQQLQHQHNVNSKQFAQAKAQGIETDLLLHKLQQDSESLKHLAQQCTASQNKLNDFLALIPNLPHDSVINSDTAAGNVVIQTVGEPRHFNFTPQDHVALGAQLQLMDYPVAVKLAGSRFTVLKGVLARLQRALIQFMLDLHVKEHGYQEIYVPALVSPECLFGTAQLPKFKADQFAVVGGERSWYLSPTAEVQLTNMVRDSIIPLEQLPLKYVAYTSCFRSEAGSYGKDLNGMMRNHQFEKVELVQIVQPELSYLVLEEIRHHAETVLQRLELPYRVVRLASDDLGFSAAKTYDLEVWLPGQNCYREISSCSNTESFQARRLQARWRDSSGNISWLHTLNGSGLAVGRTLIAVMENYQAEDGTIRVPTVLQSYMDGAKLIA
jgi:seryl-tRNA synthetase